MAHNCAHPGTIFGQRIAAPSRDAAILKMEISTMTKLATPRAALSGLLLSAAALVVPANPMIFNMAPTLQEQITALETKRDELIGDSQKIVDELDDGVDLSDDQAETINTNAVEIEKIDKRIAALRTMLPKGAGRHSTAEPTNRNDPADGSRRALAASARDPRGGFQSLGDFARVVRNSLVNGVRDPRLEIHAAAPGTYSSEQSGADGGFAVPPEFRRVIMERVFGETSLYGRTDQQFSSSNTMTFPIDMTTPWGTGGGIQATWEGEAAAKTQSKIALENVTMRLHKMACLVPVTDELLEDAPALNGYLNRKVPEKMDFKLSLSIIKGTGAGQPLGFANSPAFIVQAAEAAQTADTINAQNVAKMWARMPTNSIPTAVWLIHPDSLAQLPFMNIANQPIFVPPGGFSSAPFGTLLGRPLIPSQVCETLGDIGDIYFADLGQYLTISKAGGIKSDVSIHLWFDQDLTAFRFVLRIAGQPWWSGAIAARAGTFTQSPFVALAAR
jgi:HK97 family phage major capsid protein